jgi:hypothetical protein
MPESDPLFDQLSSAIDEFFSTASPQDIRDLLAEANYDVLKNVDVPVCEFKQDVQQALKRIDEHISMALAFIRSAELRGEEHPSMWKSIDKLLDERNAVKRSDTPYA